MRRPALLLVACLPLTACATLPESHRDRWAAVRVGKVTTYTNLRDYKEGTVAAFVRARGIIETLFIEVPGQVEVLLFDEPGKVPGPRLPLLRGWGNQPRPRGFVASGVRGLEGSQGVIVTLDRPLGEGSSPMHLMAHRLLGEALPQAPVWLHEGFATLMASGDWPVRMGKQNVLCFGYAEVSSFHLLPFDELLAADRAQAAALDARNYAMSAYVLVDYLFTGEDGRIRPLMPKMMKALGQGADVRQALPAAFPDVTPDDLPARYEAHGRILRDQRRKPCAITVLDPTPPWDAAAVRKTALEEDRLQALIDRVRAAAAAAGELDWMPAR